LVVQAAKDVSTSREILTNLFDRIGNFFLRLEIYTGVRPTAAMTDMIVQIMVEVLTILAVATKEMERGRLSELNQSYIFHFVSHIYSEKYLKKLMGDTEVEDSLERLDKLTQEEARMASAELLRMTDMLSSQVRGVDTRVQEVGDHVGNKVQDVDGRLQGVGEKVQDVGDKMQGIDHKLDQAAYLSSICSARHSTHILPGNQLRDSLLQWLSPPDPSSNHNIACKASHSGTAKWFFQGSIFNQWKSTGPFLWIHGKRASS
jgi:hypothetical protein